MPATHAITLGNNTAQRPPNPELPPVLFLQRSFRARGLTRQ
jgi:hypothetical protein